MNLNYLKHKLTRISDSKYIFTCEKCNSIIKYDIHSNIYYYLDTGDGHFYSLMLTCDEMIIKNIIE